METENLIHCEKNTHGGSIYVYVQPIRAEDSPVLLQELVLPESANDVGKIVTDGAFIVASLINHGADTNEGPGAVIVYKKRNNGLFSYLQTIEAPLSTVEISVETNLDFGIDMVITDDNLIITTEPTLASTDSHSYIAIYEYGEFYWELVQEVFNDEKLNEKSYVSDTFTSMYGGEHSLVADNNNLIFKSYALYDGASTGSYSFLHASKIIGTFVIDFDNPIRHPQEEGDASIKTLIENNSHNLFGDPKLYNDYLMIPSVEFIDSANYVPAVLIYKRNEQGKFVYTSTLSYAVEHKLTSLDNKITHSVMLAGSHMIIRGDNLPDAYYELDEDDQTWKVSTDETFDVFNNKLYLGGCPVCHGDEPECKDVKLHLQLTNDITEISDVCLDGVTYSDGCEAEYLLIQPKSGDVSIIDYGSGSRLITPKGAAGITTITNICDTPPIAQSTPTPTDTTTPCTLNIKVGGWLQGINKSGSNWTRSFQTENGEVVRYADGEEFEDIYSNNQSYFHQFNKMLPDNVFRMLTLTPAGNFGQSYAWDIQIQRGNGIWIDAEVDYNSKMLHDPHPQTGYIPITYDIKLPTNCICEFGMISSPSNSIGDEHHDYIGSAFNGNLTDTLMANAWHSYDTTLDANKTTGVIGQSFSTPHIVTQYRIYPWYWSTRGHDPKNWTFEASNDNFNTVVILDTQTDAVFPSRDSDGNYTSVVGGIAINEYHINNTDAYMQYRLNITSNNGSQTNLIIQEIEFLGCEDTSTTTPTETTPPIAQSTPTPTETPTETNIEQDACLGPYGQIGNEDYAIGDYNPAHGAHVFGVNRAGGYHDPTSYWYAYDKETNQYVTSGGWIGQSFPAPVRIGDYAVQLIKGSFGGNIRQQDPYYWQFEASNDNFETFDVLDTYTIGGSREVSGGYGNNITNTKSYLQYRVNFQGNWGHPLYLAVRGVLLYGCFTEEIPVATPTPTETPILQPTPTPTETPTDTPTETPTETETPHILNIMFDHLNGLPNQIGNLTYSWQVENGQPVRYADGTEFDSTYLASMNKMLPDNTFRMLTLTPSGVIYPHAWNFRIQAYDGTWIPLEVCSSSRIIHPKENFDTSTIPMTYDIKLPNLDFIFNDIAVPPMPSVECEETEIDMCENGSYYDPFYQFGNEAYAIGDFNPDTGANVFIHPGRDLNKWWSAYDKDAGEYKTSGWIGQSYDVPVKITRYELEVSGGFPRSQDPKNWTFEASNDNFETFDILDVGAWSEAPSTHTSRAGAAAQGALSYIGTHNLDTNKKGYLQYRVNISENWGHPTHVSLHSIRLSGCVTEQTETPTPTPTPVAEPTPTPTETPTHDIMSQPLYGDLWAVGKNEYNMNDSAKSKSYNSTTPYQVANGHGVVTEIFGGVGQNWFIKNDGTVWSSGNRQSGLAISINQTTTIDFGSNGEFVITDYDNGTSGLQFPARIALTNVEFASYGRDAVHFKKNGDSKIYAFGSNKDGRLGTGSSDVSSSSIEFVIKENDLALTDVVQLFSTFEGTTYYRCADGSVYASGLNANSQFGQSNKSNSNKATLIWPANPLTKKVVGSNESTQILLSDGKLYGAGLALDMGFGLFSNLENTTYNSLTFQLFASDVEDVYSGSNGCLYKKTDGNLYASRQDAGYGHNPQYPHNGQHHLVTDSSNNPISNVHHAEAYNNLLDSGTTVVVLKTDGTIWELKQNSVIQQAWENGDPIENANNIFNKPYGYLFTTGEIISPILQPTPTPTETPTETPTQEELPSTISPQQMSFEDVIAIDEDGGYADRMMAYCNLTMYVSGGKYRIASGVNMLGEPETFFPSPTIEINCNCTTSTVMNQFGTELSIGNKVRIAVITESEAIAPCTNKSIFDEISFQTYELCVRPSSRTLWNPQSGIQTIQDHPMALSETPDGTWNGGTKLQASTASIISPESNYSILTLDLSSNEITEPTTLYYYCESHPNMGGQINITPCVPTPTPTETPTDTPTTFGCGKDVCPVSRAMSFGNEAVYLKPNKELWAYGAEGMSGSWFTSPPGCATRLATDVDDIGKTTASLVYRIGTKLYGFGNNQDGELGTGSKDPVTSPILIADNVRMFSTDGSGIMYVTNDDVAFASGKDYVGLLGGSETFDIRHQTTFVQVATNVDHVASMLNDHSYYVVFNDGKLKYRGVCPSESGEQNSNNEGYITYDWTHIADNVILAKGNADYGVVYLTSDNVLHGSANSQYGMLGVIPNTGNPAYESKYVKRVVATDVVDFSPHSMINLIYKTSNNNLYGMGLNVGGVLGSGLNQTANPAGSGIGTNDSPSLGTPQLIDENVAEFDHSGSALFYTKTDGSLYVAGRDFGRGANIISDHDQYPKKVCEGYTQQTPTPTENSCDKIYYSKADFPQYITVSGVLNDDVIIDNYNDAGAGSIGNLYNGDYILVLDEDGGCDQGQSGTPSYMKIGPGLTDLGEPWETSGIVIQGHECFDDNQFGRDGSGFVLYPWENGNDPSAVGGMWTQGWFFPTYHATFCPNILSGIGWHSENTEQKYPNWVIEETSSTPTPTQTSILQPTPTPTETPTETPDIMSQPLYGDLWAVGLNTFYKNDSAKSDAYTSNDPYQVANGHGTITEIYATAYSNWFLKDDGTLWSSGALEHGLYASIDNTEEKNDIAPAKIIAENVEFASLGGTTLHFKKNNDNKIYALGENDFGQLSAGITEGFTTKIETVIKTDNTPLTDVVEIASDENIVSFRCSDGSVYAAGINQPEVYQLGISSTGNINKATLIWPANALTKKVIHNQSSTLILLTNGDLYGVGHANDLPITLFPDRPLGHNSPYRVAYQPTFYKFQEDVVDIYGNGRGILLTKSDGYLYGHATFSGVGLEETGQIRPVLDADGNQINNVYKAYVGHQKTSTSSGISWFTIILKYDQTIWKLGDGSVTQLKWGDGEFITTANNICPNGLYHGHIFTVGDYV